MDQSNMHHYECVVPSRKIDSELILASSSRLSKEVRSPAVFLSQVEHSGPGVSPELRCMLSEYSFHISLPMHRNRDVTLWYRTAKVVQLCSEHELF